MRSHAPASRSHTLATLSRGITELEPLQDEYAKEERNNECKPEKTIQKKTKVHSDKV